VTGENEDEIVEFLMWFKNHVHKQPLYITIDFKPGLDNAILKVFPKVKIIACTFHAVKLLVGGLSKELNRLQSLNHGIFIKECKQARKMSLRLDHGKNIKDLSKLTQNMCCRWYDFYIEITGICNEIDVVVFQTKYISMLASITAWNASIGAKLKELLKKKVDGSVDTRRSIRIIKKTLKPSWRAILLELRKEMEEKKAQFTKIKHVLLKKPKNVMPWEKEWMDDFFKTNSWAHDIRDVVVQFYMLLESPSGKSHSFSFLDALISENCHEQLKSAIETLKSKQEYIFNYLGAWKCKRSWNGIKSIKVNAEYLNKHINSIVRGQYGFRSDESARFRLEQFLKCPIIYSRCFYVE